MSICTIPTCQNFERYCRIHKIEKTKKVYQIKKVSDKRKQLNKEYSATTKPLWKDKPCKVHSPVCTEKAQGMHHLEGKENAEKLLNTAKQIPSCNSCNSYIEDNHKWAVANGFKLKRNIKTNRYEKTVKN